jgi:GNAT superfamily N-acetyltransferase
MDEEYQIVYIERPEDSVWGIIGQGINLFNNQKAGDDKAQRICFALCAPNQEIAGGVVGQIYWDWLYVDLMWVKDELRGRGFGQRLLRRVEDEARKRGAKNVYLDTFSFQAPDFYKKQGYQVFGKLENFPSGHQRYFLTKKL